MELYTQTYTLPNVFWPEPMETVWQLLTTGPSVPGSKIPHLTMADQLFAAAVVNIPRPIRPWGAITWLSGVFQISRPTIYDLGKRAERGLERNLGGRPSRARSTAAPLGAPCRDNVVTATPNRIARTALAMALPGKIALRPMQVCLEMAFDQTRGLGTLSELLTKTGQQAGEVLRQIDHTPLGPVIVLRDETYFQDWPILLVVEPVSTTILLGVVSEDAQAETWGAALLVSQDGGAHIKGLVEDMARMYSKSQKLAEVEVSVQKDTRHIERWGGKVRRDLERKALAALRKVYKLEDQLLEEWNDILFFDQYVPAVEKAEQRMEQHDTFACWLQHLYDALELVDWRSGEIRDREINSWLLEETLRAMEQIDHALVHKFVRSLRRYQHQLLTFLDWAAEMLASYQQMLAAHISDPTQRQVFTRTVARTWRLRQAMISGHRSWRHQTAEAESLLEQLLDGDETLVAFSVYLMHILDAAGHTSSLIECINGLLKSFLNNRRAFRNRDTAQAYLNLFMLWHNMRVYERGKRAGKSPYQWAGIDPGSDDWLELLGYPADA